MLIFNFLIFFFYMYSFVLSLSIVLTVLSMYFIGVSGLRVLPLSINGMEWKVIENDTSIDQKLYGFVLVSHCNNSSILYRFRDI